MQDLSTYCFTGPGVTYGGGHVHQVKCRTGSASSGQAHTHAVGLGACCKSCAVGKSCESGLGADAGDTAKTLLILGTVAAVGIFLLPRALRKMY